MCCIANIEEARIAIVAGKLAAFIAAVRPSAQ